MAYLIDLPTFSDDRGTLSVVERLLPFEIKRFYYIYDVTAKRGGHRHHKTVQALICVGGSCDVYVNNGTSEQVYVLDQLNKCLILETIDWHTMDNFTPSAVLLVYSSEYYDRNDYIDEAYT